MLIVSIFFSISGNYPKVNKRVIILKEKPKKIPNSGCRCFATGLIEVKYVSFLRVVAMHETAT